MRKDEYCCRCGRDRKQVRKDGTLGTCKVYGSWYKRHIWLPNKKLADSEKQI